MAEMILNVLALSAIVLTIAGALMYVHARSNTRARIGQRLRAGPGGSGSSRRTRRGAAAQGGTQAAGGVSRTLAGVLTGVGRAIPLFDANQRAEISRKLVSAGHRHPAALLIVIGISVGTALLVSLLAATFVWPQLEGGQPALRFGAPLLGAYLGMMIPRIVLDRLVQRRKKAIERNFPDALDLLVVCTNSGLGMNAALMRVAHELNFLAPELADELMLTATELQLSGEADVVLRKLAERIDLPSVRGLVSTLIQSHQFGTPIGQALRVLSRSERTARLMRTEEQAAKLATKITLPMMLFILPTVLIIAGAPAVMRLMEALGK